MNDALHHLQDKSSSSEKEGNIGIKITDGAIVALSTAQVSVQKLTASDPTNKEPSMESYTTPDHFTPEVKVWVAL